MTDNRTNLDTGSSTPPAEPGDDGPSLAWAPLDELFDNHDEYSRAPTDALVGLSTSVAFDGGERVDCRFGQGLMEWSADRDLPWGRSGEDSCQVVATDRQGLFVVTVSRVSERVSTLSVLDLPGQRVATVATAFVETGGAVREQTRVLHGALDGAPVRPLPRTDELVGLRVHHRYSTTHAFEHMYVDPDHYMWRGVEGPEFGVGGFEPAEAYRVDDELYLFTWHEVANPFSGAILIDLRGRRAVGRLFGWHQERLEAMEIPTGSIATVLNRTTYEGL